MHTLVLIDGNSLLNRAYFATGMLTTKSGTPTNAVFGFTKLMLKLIDDIGPDRMIVTFDVKAPTFRHRMYDGYKATRKPMPEDLAVQLSMLKSLLASMKIAMCEKPGYEADDLIGTLSRKFPDTKSIIITGDRDSYQLVDECTDVYFTKRGVSDLLRLNRDNFEEIVGYAPAQVIDMKALMGDSSDNIPGVYGIGEKTARALIASYKTLDGVYEHIGEIAGKTREKLEAGKESAYLSRTLATIDRAVPLELKAEDCAVRMPFSDEVKEQFRELEFTSLLKPELFSPGPEEAKPKETAEEKTTSVTVTEENAGAVSKTLAESKEWFAAAEGNVCTVLSENTEYVLRRKEGLLDSGLERETLREIFRAALSKDTAVVAWSSKDFRHFLLECGTEADFLPGDVSLMKYLTDYTGKDETLSQVLGQNGLDSGHPASGVRKLYALYGDKVRKQGMESLYTEIELPLAKVLFEMEKDGVKVDYGALAGFETRYKTFISQLTEEIYEQAGQTFNINSPQQLGTVLFEKLRLPGGKKTKKGWSTAADVLEKLRYNYKIVDDVLRCRHYQKLLSTYVDGFRPYIEPDTQLVHTTFNQTQTATGRLSSSNPNLQNIPVRDEEGRELRKLFVPRSEGRVFIDADYSQIELRLLAHCSGCRELIDAYNRGEDIHALTASQVFSVPLGEVTKEQRRAAKAVNFGIIYGISEFGLASNLNISNRQAGDYIRKYFETYSDVKAYMNENVAFAKKHGYVTTLFGRKRMIPEISSSNYNIRSFGERAAMNMPLQGTSADIIKIAMIRVYERLKKEGLRSRLVLQVHDELLIDAYEDEREFVASILREEMEGAADLKVPLTAEVHSGKNWFEAK